MATLIELAKLSGDAGVLAVAEILNSTIELQDIQFYPANGLTSHTVAQRTSLPAGSWRQLNDGVASETSKSRNQVFGVGILESFSKVDKELVNLSQNPNAFRAQEDQAFVEGLGQTFATELFYGNLNTNPAGFNGFATWLNLTSKANVIGASGTGSDTTSIYVVQWGLGRVYCVYPQHSPAGLQVEDMGLQLMAGTTSGTLMENFVTHFIMRSGLVIHDPRCIQRIANIESAGTSNTFDDDDLITALNNLPFAGKGAVIYCNKTVKTQMDILAKDKSNVSYTSSEVFGTEITRFKGVPVRRVDEILDTETAIS